MNQIRYFLALCEERNFTRAAKRCGVSQPSLDKRHKAIGAKTPLDHYSIATREK